MSLDTSPEVLNTSGNKHIPSHIRGIQVNPTLLEFSFYMDSSRRVEYKGITAKTMAVLLLNEEGISLDEVLLATEPSLPGHVGLVEELLSSSVLRAKDVLLELSAKKFDDDQPRYAINRRDRHMFFEGVQPEDLVSLATAQLTA